MGTIGAGGSILAVPVLVYILEVDEVSATGYSLFIVGMASAFGMLDYFRRKEIKFSVALWFGIPSIFAVFATRSFLIPALPETIFTAGSFVLSKGLMIMAVFSIMMIAASVSMILPFREKSIQSGSVPNPFLSLLEGVLVGTFTGFVGAGGGFLIVPVLVMFFRLEMKTAIGTSLAIIAAKSLAGFGGEIMAHGNQIDWSILSWFTSLSIAGSIAGSRLSRILPAKSLKPVFGVFVFLTGVFIIGKEIAGGFRP